MDSIQKFGLGYCDLPTMIWNVSILLRSVTLNIDSRDKRHIPIYFYILSVVGAACYFYVYLISMVWFVFWRCNETGDLLAALVVFSLGVASEIGTVKMLFIFFYIDKVKQIVSGCLAIDALVIPSSRFSDNLLRLLRQIKKRAMIFWIVLVTNGTIYILKPLLLPGRHLMEDLYIIYGLEPMYQSPNYEISLLLMAVSVFFCCYLPANVTALIIVVTGYIEAQMLAWSVELLHLWDDAKNNCISQHPVSGCNDYRNKALNEYVKKKLIVISRAHAANINIMHQIEDVYRGAIALEFSLLGMGLIAELLGGLEKTYLQVPFALMQVAMDCLTGQRIMDASVVFERAVYNCKWEHFDKNNMKIVLVMLQSSQKTMMLSAGGITKLSFSCLMSVIRSVYSAYTTLRSTMK